MLQATTSQQQSTATTISTKNDTLSVGDKLFVSWPSEEDGARCESKPLVGKVLEIISSKKVKGGSNLKYKIFFSKLNETRVMRLHDLEWSVKKKKNSKIPCISEGNIIHPLSLTVMIIAYISLQKLSPSIKIRLFLKLRKGNLRNLN